MTAQTDWLTRYGVCRSECWQRILPAPEPGLNAMRPEVLLTAFSQALFTVSHSSVQHIVGNGELPDADLQARVLALVASDFHGRAVGFLLAD